MCDATYAVMIYPGEEIIAGDNEHFHVLAFLPLEDEGSSFVGFLQVEAA